MTNKDLFKAFLDQQPRRELKIDRGPAGLKVMSFVNSETFAAYSYLGSAQASVESALDSAFLSRNLKRVAAGKEMRGAMGDSEQDLLRAALVFAAAGLDAALKRLVRDALPTLAGYNKVTRDELHRFAESHIRGDAVSVDPKALIRVLMADEASPRDVLVEAWSTELTEGSMQSVERVNEVVTALGITDATLRKRIARSGDTKLRDAFRERNLVVHELDLLPVRSLDEPVDKSGIRRRKRARGAEAITAWCSEVLSVGYLVCDHVYNNVDEAKP